MPITYNGVHSILFLESSQALSPGDTLTEYTSLKHTWRDLHLVPKTRPFVETSEANISMYSDTVSSKVFDVTDVVAGGQTFDSRKGTWEFYVDHDKWNNWYTAKNTIEDYLNGKRLYCCLMDDPSVLYYGRFTISSWDDGSDYSSVSIEYDLDWDTYIADDYNKPISLSVSLKSNAPTFYTRQKKNVIKKWINATVYYKGYRIDNAIIDDIPGEFTVVDYGNQTIAIQYSENGMSTNTKYTVSSEIVIEIKQDIIQSISAYYRNGMPDSMIVGDAKDSIRNYINIEAIYISGYSEIVDGSHSDIITGIFENSGLQTVNITYSGLNTSIEIMIIEPTIGHVVAQFRSTQPTISVGDSKDIIRQYIILIIYYQNPTTTRTIAGTNADSIDGVFTESGQQYVWLSYKGNNMVVGVTVSN